MVCKEQHPSELQFSTVGKRLLVEVPWLSANALRNRLLAQGIRATACFDPHTRTAILEFDGNIDPECVRAILDDAGERSRAG